ncbi:hypothetical protein ONA70_21810 [Micromonospora yasonensis]|uniref:hypothetical protein n=1 Tax=Micromonospora yasonensis TaxID=1128667 RepID=UPI0022300F44|nr:hypothetical protein [Micromonospora yasonensis]MCW3842740.1 hypothetical protein [Micromonospora yasonensis]
MTQRIGTAATIRRVAGIATAVLATAALSAGCGTTNDTSAGGTGSTPAASPSVDPKAVLLAAVPVEEDPGFRFSIVDGTDKVVGVVDPAAHAMELGLSQKNDDPEFTMDLTFRMIDDKSWMRVKLKGISGLHEMLKLPKHWMTLDRTKLDDPTDAPVYEGTDPANTAAIIRTADTVEDKGNGTYTGFADLTNGQDVATAVDGVDVAALGEAARKVPFTAVVGPDGNLTSLTLDIPAGGKQKAITFVVRYFDFGKAPKLSAPSDDEVRKAPTSAYELLNS